MKILRVPVLMLILLLVFIGCSTHTRTQSMAPRLRGQNVVCILFHDSHFNYLLRNKISDNVVEKGYKVVSDDEFWADRYDPDDYAAVVILAKYEARGAMRIIDEYMNQYGDLDKIIVSLSHEWDLDGDKINKQYDAYTAASKDFDQDEVLTKIMADLDRILTK